MLKLEIEKNKNKDLFTKTLRQLKEKIAGNKLVFVNDNFNCIDSYKDNNLNMYSIEYNCFYEAIKITIYINF